LVAAVAIAAGLAPLMAVPASAVAAAQAREFAYATNFADNNVLVINTATNTVINTIPVGNFPAGIAIARIGSAPRPPHRHTKDRSLAVNDSKNRIHADVNQSTHSQHGSRAASRSADHRGAQNGPPSKRRGIRR
jgi:YVTN family beta-propeller protein